MTLRRYLLPAIIASTVLAAAVFFFELSPKDRRTQSPKPKDQPSEVCLGYPWNDPNSSDLRLMTVVVEDSGAFIGKIRIPYDAFRYFLIHHARDYRPDHVLIVGAIDCPFGRCVEVFDTLWSLNLYPTLDCHAIPPGTRYPEIEIWKDGEPPDEAADAREGDSISMKTVTGSH